MRKLMFFLLSVVVGGILAVSGSAQIVVPPLCGCTKLLPGTPWPDGSPGTVPFGFPMPSLTGVTNGASSTTATFVCSATYNGGTQTWTCMVAGAVTFNPYTPTPYTGMTGFWSPGKVTTWTGAGHFDTTIPNTKNETHTTTCTGMLGTWINIVYPAGGTGSPVWYRRGDYWYCASQ